MRKFPETFSVWTKEFDWSSWDMEGRWDQHWSSMSFGNFGVVFWFNGNFSYLMPSDEEIRSHTKKHCEKAGAKERAVLIVYY
jgi:hypothetical protein